MNSTTPTPHPLRILYADDVRELRDVASISVKRDGHQIECVCDGQEALDRLTAAPDAFDVLISDHHMPRLNGLGLITALRAQAFPGKIIIFCSALDPAVHEAYRRLAVDRILYKPVFPSDLRHILAEIGAATSDAA